MVIATLSFVPGNVNLAKADEDPFKLPGSFSGSFGFFSEYVFRGITQTDEHPAIQGNFDWSHNSGVYLGVWGSNVDFGDADQANSEFDWYFGYAREMLGVTWDMGGVYYTYPGANDNLVYDYFEYKLGISKEFSLISMGLTGFYTPQNTAGSGNATYLVYDAEVPLLHGVAMTGHVGYQWLTDETAAGRPDTLDWSIGLAYSTNGFDLSLQYVDTDLNSTECADGCEGTAVFGITKSF